MPSTILAVQKISTESYAAFESRGYKTLMPARLSEVPVAAFSNNETIIPSPIRFLPDYIKARVENKIDLVGNFYNVLKNFAPLPALNPPIVVIRVLDKEDEAIKLGMEAIAGQKGTFVGQPNWDSFKKILSNGVADTRFQPGKISMSGYKSFFFSSILLHAAYTIANKPVNLAEWPISYLATDFNNLDGASKTFKGFSYSGSDVSTVQDNVGLSKEHHYCVTSRMVPIAFNGAAPGVISDKKSMKLILDKGKNPGVFLEYFRDMVMPDKHIVISIVQRLFFRAFGDSIDVASRNFQQFMVGWSTLQHCEQGQALQHAFFCLNLAENAQAGIFPIFSGGFYRGSVVYGQFTLMVRYKKVELEDWTSIEKYYDALDLHSKRLAEIANLIEGVTNADGSKKYPTPISSVDTPKKFVDRFRAIVLGDLTTPVLDSIVEKADDLQYIQSRYAEPSQKNILLLIHVARTGDRDSFRDLDPYFKGGILRRIHGNVSYALSFFGPSPPSFSYGIGKDRQVFQIPKNNTDQDPNLLIHDGKSSLAYLPFKRVGILGAINQWDSLLSTGKIMIPPGRQDKKEFTNQTLMDGKIHAQEFLKVYEGLKAAVVDFSVRDSSTNKRKRADEVGEGSSKRRVEKKSAFEKLAIDAGDF